MAKGKSILSDGVSLGVSTTLLNRPGPCPGEGGQRRVNTRWLGGGGGCCCGLFVLAFLMFYWFVFICILFLVLRENKKMRLCGREEGGSGGD